MSMPLGDRRSCFAWSSSQAANSFTSGRSAAAAEVIAKQPSAIHLRFLQSLVQVAAEKNNTIVLPIPVGASANRVWPCVSAR